MQKNMQKIGCVIMASGESKRFGASKLLFPLQGRPLIQYALSLISSFPLETVVLTRSAEVANFLQSYTSFWESCSALPLESCSVFPSEKTPLALLPPRTILHDKPYRNDVVRIGVSALSHCDGIIFFPADQPLLQRSSMSRFLQSISSQTDAIWRTIHENTPGAPVYFPKWCFPLLQRLPEKSGGSYLIKKHPQQVKVSPVTDAYELWDVDTPEDLDRISKYAQK